MKIYNNYHKHDHVSNLFSPDTNTKAEEYIKKTIEYGFKNYFTTNHGSFGDIFEAKMLCNQYGLRCFAGIEGYIVPNPLEKDKSNYHFIAIPLTNRARRQLNVASSRANMEGYYYKPRFFIEDLLKIDPHECIITTACVAGLLKDSTSYEQIFLPLAEYYKDSIMLEVQTHLDPLQQAINKRAIKLSNKYGFKLIAANDSHYVDEAGQIERLELLKGKHITYDEEDNFILDFPSAETMKERFIKQGILSEAQIDEAISNTLIFDQCEEIDLDDSIKMPTIYPNLTPKERVTELKKHVTTKFKKIAKEEGIIPGTKEFEMYKQGIQYEMKIIEDTNDIVKTADYFLFNERNVDLAVNKYNGVLTRGGRGSCASFYINRILGMTQLDRFKINLPIFPDRFASSARLVENRSLPDVDFNIVAQTPFVSASRELLGEHGCYPMYAPGTMQLSEAFRNVCRSRNMDFDTFNEIGKDIEKYIDDEYWGPIIEEANKYVGTIISGSVHPCAHILSDKNLIEEYGVTKLGDFYCVLITSSEADYWKVLKNDYLIVKVWKLISETFEMIGQPIISSYQLLNTIKDDERIWDLFKNGITCTLNQVDSDNGMKQAQRYGIHSFEQGAYITAAIRPSFDSWREQFLNHEEYSTGSKDLDNVLENTEHYILYQENLMQYFEWLGVTPAESIGLIKKISKKKIHPEDFKNLESRIKSRWIENTGSEDMFQETWEMIQSCMSYGFCSAHAASTSLDMCYGAYLKVNYPLEYYTVCFNNYEGDEIRTTKLTKELEYFNIELSDIRFRHSTAKYTCDKTTRTIFKGLSSIKYLSDSAANDLYTLKDNVYDNFIQLLIDLKNTSCDARQLDILIKLDFFSEFGNPNQLLAQVKMFNDIYGKKQFKKDKCEIPERLMKKYAGKETEKMYTQVDTTELMYDLAGYTDEITTSLIERLKWSNELLGYLNITKPNWPEAVHYVQVIDGNWITLYRMKDGYSFKIKTRKAHFNKNKFSEGQLIKILEITQENKYVKTANEEWGRSDELEDILKSWSIIKEG